MKSALYILRLTLVAFALFAGFSCTHSSEDQKNSTVTIKDTKPSTTTKPKKNVTLTIIKDKKELIEQDDKSENDEQEPPAQKSCSEIAKSFCTTNDKTYGNFPAKCNLTKYLGSSLPEKNTLTTWGKNVCEAKMFLAKEACDLGYNVEKMDSVNCLPDSTEQTCPPKKVLCKDEQEPTVCTAKSYKNRKLHFSQHPKAWGVNECWARYRLKEVACKLNLLPDEIADVSCEQDFTKGECPINEATVCNSNEKLPKAFFVCEAKKYGTKDLKTPLVTYGESKCEAKIALFHMACQYTNSSNKLRPSLLGKINCYSEL